MGGCVNWPVSTWTSKSIFETFWFSVVILWLAFLWWNVKQILRRICHPQPCWIFFIFLSGVFVVMLSTTWDFHFLRLKEYASHIDNDNFQYAACAWVNYRPHHRQVIGAHCTKVTVRQSWIECSWRPATGAERRWDHWIQCLIKTPNAARRISCKVGIPRLIILSLVCESDVKEFHGELSNPLFEKNVHGQRHPGEVDKATRSPIS